MFGASWKTSVMGYAFAILAVVQEMNKSGTVIPHTVEGWIAYVAGFVVAVMGYVARDNGVSSEAAGAK